MNETNENSKITRKDFLSYILIAAGVSSVAGGIYFFQRGESIKQPFTVEAIRDEFSDVQESFYMIGEKYMEKSSHGVSTSHLVQEINKKLSSDRIDKSTLSDLSDLLRQQIRLDFQQSNLIYLDGWIITETEAQICTLIFME